MSNKVELFSAREAFDQATRICIDETCPIKSITFNTADEALHYVNKIVIAAAAKGRMFAKFCVYVDYPEEIKFWQTLADSEYKVYRGLGGELYALSWECGAPFEIPIYLLEKES